MPWATLARVLDRVRVPIAAAAGIACSLYMSLGPFRWLLQARLVVFAVWFVVVFAVVIVVLTALLALAEHKAEELASTPVLPFAIAEYRDRDRDPPPAADPPSRSPAPAAPSRASPRADSSPRPAARAATDDPAFLREPT